MVRRMASRCALVALWVLCVIALSGAFKSLQMQKLTQVATSGGKAPLRMSVYSVEQGIPAQLVEERDACGVGFIASLDNEPSHSILQQSLAACACMEHRGATSSDNISGDGAGVMTSIPWELLQSIVGPTRLTNKDGSSANGVAMVFMPKDATLHASTVKLVEQVAKENGFTVTGWRDVPVNDAVLGTLARDFVPRIQQFAVQRTDPIASQMPDARAFEKALYDLRREVQGLFRKNEVKDGYICSLSSKTIVYKGMLRSCDLPLFYTDLTNPLYKTEFSIYHRRFSTNTIPKWFLAQPMRMLAHNGEINTLLGNINWVKARQYSLRAENKQQLDDSMMTPPAGKAQKVRSPLVDLGRSDSANLDSILDFYVQSGRSPAEAIMMLVPEAYSSQPSMKNTPVVAEFYKYFESIQEAWDGPALLVFSDGEAVCAALDRNGLRPARYMVLRDDAGKEAVHVMSEVGVTKALEQFTSVGEKPQGNFQIVDSGRLGPGEMIAVDLIKKKMLLNQELKTTIAASSPYAEWNAKSIQHVQQLPNTLDVGQFVSKYIRDEAEKKMAMQTMDDKDATGPIGATIDPADLITTQTVFGWGTEDVEVQIDAMAKDGIEATFCMGDDAPLAALSSFSHTLYDYFKQRFAQVTNPPIDPLREGAVMSLTMFLGPKGDAMQRTMQQNTRVRIDSPVLNTAELKAIESTPGVKMSTLSTLYPMPTALTLGGLKETVDRICQEAIKAVQGGATIINLSDMGGFEGYQDVAYIPPLMAVGAVHHRLIEAGLRTRASIIVTTGQAWSTHHFACLIGFGASAVLPYAAYDAVINWHQQKRNQLAMDRGDITKMSAAKAIANYRKAVEKGILKVLSKMGISLLTSYQGAQIFESIGLSDEVLMTAFKGTPSRVSGLSFDDIAAENADFSRRTFGDAAFSGMADRVASEGEGKSKKLFNYGFLNFFKSGEYHHNNQPLIKQLHSSIRNNDQDLFKLYEQSITSRVPTTIRDCLEFVQHGPSARQPVPLDSVESAESIMKRFCSGGMSLGALSREAHETLAISMNRIGGKSNSGEGGEDPMRMNKITDVTSDGSSATFPHLKGLKANDDPGSRIKQVASGRFGVTPQYLVNADQLEIKIAQGAKPGEGGQLPGPKIDNYIARLRKSKPGVTLISPPPHHDIYSIEDLSQLIYDLHQINPTAGVSVKLVSEVGIGTVASGVTKAGADIIQVSGHDGGTGASPVSSIKHAGSPWELGLVEVHQTLLQNKLRERVLLRVDGGLKSGWDVVMAAAMGAEEYGFGTIAMIAEGCIMARICHTNKCPVGITTQNEALRKKFPGTPDNVVTFFGYVAEEVRQILAQLGYTSLDQIIGRPGVLKQRDVQLKKATNIDMSFILNNLVCVPSVGENLCDPEDSSERAWLKKGPPFSNGHTFDDAILADAEIATAIQQHKTVSRTMRICNQDRSAFARISGAIAKQHGDNNFQGRLRFALTGGAGQSFCAFLGQGMEVTLRGYANDYVGKGMAGGKVVVAPPEGDKPSAGRPALRSTGYSMVGNTVLYGATGGQLWVNGRGGERFAVRNSGALSVVEGLGDHGCEYMTAGSVVVLGSCGRNFGAGMTGGLAFVLDDEAWLDGLPEDPLRLPFSDFVNKETVSLVKLGPQYAAAKTFLQETLQQHVTETGSLRAQRVLAKIDEALSRMTLLLPASEKANGLAQVVGAPAAATTTAVSANKQ